jgi:amino acid transporter
VVSSEVAEVATGVRVPTGPFVRKSIEALQADATSHGLRRTLGPLHLVLLGIGCILGAGIYVFPGTAAANFAGPAVMVSFVLAGTACALTALCYAELASTMPVSGAGLAFATVCFCTMWLHSRRPDLPRPFRVPLGGFWIGRAWIGYIPAIALVLCIAMILPVLIDIGLQAASGQPLMAIFLVLYVAVGGTLYAGYGRRHSALAGGSTPA